MTMDISSGRLPTAMALLLVFLVSCFCFTSAEALAAHEGNGNITIKWDVTGWTLDGYIGVVTVYNIRPIRHTTPGERWRLGWRWARMEVIWKAVGVSIEERGDCSAFLGNIPSCCKQNPTVLLKRKANKSTSSFQLRVGGAGTTNRTVKLPSNSTLKFPGNVGFTCGPAKIVRPTRFISRDKRRITQALMTWNITCLPTKNHP